MKAILVIDMPKRCVDCPICEDEGYPLCTAIHKNIGSLAYYFGGDKERNPYCPLRPMPHKLQADWYTGKYKEGFNACLEEITGETCAIQKTDTLTLKR